MISRREVAWTYKTRRVVPLCTREYHLIDSMQQNRNLFMIIIISLYNIYTLCNTVTQSQSTLSYL